MSEPLPYHCPTLNGNFFKPPCDRQIEEAKEKRAKFPNAMLGFLEKCLECGGKDLMQREGATSVVNECTLSPENRQVIAQNEPISSSEDHGRPLPEKTGNYDKNYDKADDVQEKADLAGIVQDKGEKDVIVLKGVLDAIDAFEALKGVSPTRIMLAEYLNIKPYKIDLLIKELRTRGEIEIVPDSWPNEVRRTGLISSTANDVAKINTNPGLSTCEILQTDSSDACKNETKNRTEIRTTQEDQSMVAVVKFKSREEAEKYMGPGKIPEHEDPSLPEPAIPTCTRPDCEAPGSPVKIDKLGRSMGMCQACVSARGRRGGFGAQSGKLPASVVTMLDQTKYADLKAWLEAQAEENERTLIQEIVYRLKMAMREAST